MPLAVLALGAQHETRLRPAMAALAVGVRREVAREEHGGDAVGIGREIGPRAELGFQPDELPGQRLAGKPYVFHLHGGAFDHYHAGLSSLERAWVRHTIRGAKVVFVLSESWAGWLREAIGHPDVRVLPNPVLPVALPPDVPREAQTLLFLGRLEPEKGVFVLVEAHSGRCTRAPRAASAAKRGAPKTSRKRA